MLGCRDYSHAKRFPFISVMLLKLSVLTFNSELFFNVAYLKDSMPDEPQKGGHKITNNIIVIKLSEPIAKKRWEGEKNTTPLPSTLSRQSSPPTHKHHFNS